MTTRYYRQFIPDLALSIERATGEVPDDGKYHVLHDGASVGAFRSLKAAQVEFRRIVEESGYRPAPPDSGKTTSEMMTDRYMEAKDLYWASSHRYRQRGGQGP